MSFKYFTMTLSLLTGVAALPAGSMAAPPRSCVAGKPTAASYTWNFVQEASNLLSSIRQDATGARSHAARLQSFTDDEYLSWEAHAQQLAAIRSEIDDMGGKLCRLEQIRLEVKPWQQQAIDRLAPKVRLMADNADDAVTYLNQNQGRFWVPTYQKYVNNLYSEASRLTKSVKSFEEYATVHREDVHLQKALGLGPHS